MARAATSDAVDDRRGARARCVDGLRWRRDREAFRACWLFGERFADDARAAEVAFAAGGLAEELVALDDAARAYSRAIVLSSSNERDAPVLPGVMADALLARARVRAAQGELDDARADLGLFLHAVPGAARRDDVVRLERALRMAPGDAER